MKKITSLLSFLLLISYTVSAQAKKGSKEKIKAYKIAYLTEKLDLSENEAEKFWPVYNAYDNKVNELRHKGKFSLRKQITKAGGIDALSDSEAKNIALKMSNSNKEMYEITNKFYSKLPTILSYKKIIKLEVAEREFHRKLLRKLRGKRKE